MSCLHLVPTGTATPVPVASATGVLTWNFLSPDSDGLDLGQ
jgi:hypothetical protein